ncbi:hypothetical protein AVEN_178667-1 [Araneus ventricosus]|uniref:Uncharacterized protein n=1 Tax=Araneus ventricosus TaxID=182803 RepID=A0A4Y2I9I0_ARAVE|nr:hypothetical protein AVEN_178667-1 [Araneus ventricosus]
MLSSLQWLAHMCLGKRGVFLQFGQCQLSSLIEELGRSRILRCLYLNGLRNQRVKSFKVPLMWRGNLERRMSAQALSSSSDHSLTKRGTSLYSPIVV